MGVGVLLSVLAALACASDAQTLPEHECPTLNTTSPVGIGCPCSLEPEALTFSNISFVRQTGLDFEDSQRLLAVRVDADVVEASCAAGGRCGVCEAEAVCARIPDTAANSTLGVCVPCLLGRYCPEHTANPNLDEDANLCDAGNHCPTPGERLPCPPGFFCPQGVSTPVSCNITNPDTDEFLFLGGVTCGENSTHPFTPCACGTYCPDPATNVTCPSGHYCPPLSMAPVGCWALTMCGEGLCKPPPSLGGPLGVVVILLCFFMLSFAFHFWWIAVQRRRALGVAVSDDMAKLRTNLLRMAGVPPPRTKLKGFKRKALTLEIGFRDLGLVVGKDKVVLAGVNGSFPPSNLTAIMGPSGSGKTTMLNVLCGKAGYGRMRGEVTVNGEEMAIRELKAVTGYVPQDDVVHTELTVLENLLFSANMRLDRKYSRRQLEDIVADTVSVLQLTHIQNSVVGSPENRGISGGQRKRVNVGLELVTNPTLLFLDEPTSGLDSTSSEEILGCLKQMANLGMTIVTVIHQPRLSIYEMFDNVLLLGKGGRTTYIGKAARAQSYFEEIGFRCPLGDNPPDFFLDVLSDRRTNHNDPALKGTRLFDKWEEYCKSGEAERFEQPVAKRKATLKVNEATNLVKQLRIVFAEISPGCGNNLPSFKLGLLLRSLGLMLTEEEVNDIRSEFDPHNTGEIRADTVAKNLAVGSNANSLRRGSLATIVHRQSALRMQIKSHQRATDMEMEELKGPEDKLELSAPAAELAAPLKRISVRDELKQGVRPKLAWQQFLTVLHRRLVLWWRSKTQRLSDLLLTIATAYIIGLLLGSGWVFTRSAPKYLQAHLALSVLTCTFSLFPFRDKVIYWREVASGMNPTSFFLATILLDLLDVWVRPLVFQYVFLSVTQPNIKGADFLAVTWMLTWVWSGVGYLLANALLAKATVGSVVVPLILGGFFTGVSPPLSQYNNGQNDFMIGLLALSPNRWSVEAATLKHLEGLPPHFKPLVDRYLEAIGYERSNYTPALLAMFFMGLAYRVLAYVALKQTNKSKQQ